MAISGEPFDLGEYKLVAWCQVCDISGRGGEKVGRALVVKIYLKGPLGAQVPDLSVRV